MVRGFRSRLPMQRTGVRSLFRSPVPADNSASELRPQSQHAQSLRCQREKPPEREAHPPRLGSGPSLPQLEKAHPATKAQHGQK